MSIDNQAVVGRWMHSHEEDTDTEMVFRPATFALPLSRGRRQLELIADGTVIDSRIGPTDVPQNESGQWELLDDGALVLKDARGQDTTLQIVRAEPERLVFKKTH